MKRALVSVTNKDGIVDFCKGLVDLGFEIVSTGGTMAKLQAENVPCIAIDDVTGFPEILDGRVKTLHPKFMVDYYSVVIFKNTLTQLKKWTSNQLMWFVLIYMNLKKR